jgi:hypothetical protein
LICDHIDDAVGLRDRTWRGHGRRGRKSLGLGDLRDPGVRHGDARQSTNAMAADRIIF